VTEDPLIKEGKARRRQTADRLGIPTGGHREMKKPSTHKVSEHGNLEAGRRGRMNPNPNDEEKGTGDGP